MKRMDKIYFVLGVVLIVGGLIAGGISQLTDPKPKISPSITPIPTVTIFESLSPTTASSAVMPTGNVLGEKTGEQAVVVRVIDGDTIEVNINNTKETVRFIGVDTPETVDPRKKVQCFGKEASNFTASYLLDKTVFLESDPTQDNRDKYQRILRYVFLEDGTNYNKLLIAQGYAHEYTYYLPYKYQAEFKLAEQEARENNRGLWSTCP